MRGLWIFFFIIILCPAATALFDSVFEGGFHWISQRAGDSFKQAIRVAVLALSVSPRVGADQWPVLFSLRQSLGWVSVFFVIMMMMQGIRYIAAADSPSQMQAAKSEMKKLVGGMILVSFSDVIYVLSLDIADAMTMALAGSLDTSSNALEIGIFANFSGILCLILPLGGLLAIGICLVTLVRYLALAFLWAVFPLVLAFNISGFAPLTRIGSKCIGLFISCLMAGPIMGGLMSLSLGLLSQATGSAFENENVLETVFTVFMALAGLLAALVSPIFVFAGPAAKMAGAIAPAAGSFGGAAVGGLAGAHALAHADSGGGRNVQSPFEGVKEAAARAAATKDYSADERGMGLFFERLKREGVLEVDNRGIFQVGSAARHRADGTNILEGLVERGMPHGRGFGDEKSIRMAHQANAISDERIVLKNAVSKDLYAGYGVDAARDDEGFSVNIRGPGSSGFFRIPNQAAGDEYELIEIIGDMGSSAGMNPMIAARDLQEARK